MITSQKFGDWSKSLTTSERNEKYRDRYYRIENLNNILVAEAIASFLSQIISIDSCPEIKIYCDKILTVHKLLKC